MRGLPVFEWKITEIGWGENEYWVLAAPLGDPRRELGLGPDFIGTAETKKPQVSRSRAFSFISGAPASFELGCKVPVFAGLCRFGIG